MREYRGEAAVVAEVEGAEWRVLGDPRATRSEMFRMDRILESKEIHLLHAQHRRLFSALRGLFFSGGSPCEEGAGHVRTFAAPTPARYRFSSCREPRS